MLLFLQWCSFANTLDNGLAPQEKNQISPDQLIISAARTGCNSDEVTRKRLDF